MRRQTKRGSSWYGGRGSTRKIAGLRRENSHTSSGGKQALHELQELWRSLQKEVNRKWKRTLPFADYIVDRWERARLLGFGTGASIYDSSLVLGDVTVGDHTWIGPFTVLDGSGGLEIGSFCSISAGVQIYTHDTVDWAVSGGQAESKKAPTRIGSRCYIGPNTVIAKGVNIGDGAIIGANSLVLHDIPAGKRAYGIPCEIADQHLPQDPIEER